jgi:hypothetical protein
MRKLQHPNVLQLYTSFVVGRELWLVMPYMAHGSVRNVMKKQGLTQVGGSLAGNSLGAWLLCACPQRRHVAAAETAAGQDLVAGISKRCAALFSGLPFESGGKTSSAPATCCTSRWPGTV